MLSTKRKHDIRARLGVTTMTHSNVDENMNLALEIEKPRKTYAPPKLMRIDDFDIASGNTNVPENNNGVLES